MKTKGYDVNEEEEEKTTGKPRALKIRSTVALPTVNIPTKKRKKKKKLRQRDI